jgi:hypothetical protein
MFIRFVVHQLDCSSGKRRGALQAAYRLQGSELVAAHDAHRLAAALSWFDEKLKRPTRLTRSRRPHRESQAICWFKRDATEHLATMRDLQFILETYGTRVEMITSRRPGYIVYEDEFQVAAYPFSDTVA